jgi:hypothetical protein
MPVSPTLDGTRFCQFLATRTTYDSEIIKDVRPVDNFWLSRFPRGTWDAYNNSVLIQNRFRHVDAPQDRLWEDYTNANCTSSPCDPAEHEIGYGQTQLQYGLVKQSWKSPPFCFDQIMTQVLAREQLEQIIGDVLRPATARITSNLYRRSMLDLANSEGNCYSCGATLTPMTFTWNVANNRLQGITITGTDPASLLTAEHLKQRYLPLVMRGAMGKNPTDMGHYLEAVTDLETIYRLERTANVVQGGATPASSQARWQWTSFADNAKFHKYGWSGALGNFAFGTDLYVFRFNRIAANQFNLVPQYLNIPIPPAEGGGMRSVVNDAWLNAGYQFTILWNQNAARALWFKAAAANGQMPFAVRNFTGNWQFVTDNIGIPNPRRNKGIWIADFMCGIKPRYGEFIEALFHQIQPEQIVAQAKTTVDPEYDPNFAQQASVECCTTTTWTHQFTVLRKTDNSILIPASGVTCNGDIIANAEITEAAPVSNTQAAFATQLTNLAATLNTALTPTAALGTWSKTADDKLQLAGTRCSSITISWDVS